jgi:hypothetical protein
VREAAERGYRRGVIGDFVFAKARRVWPGHPDDEAALADVPIDDVQLGVAGRTLLAPN